MLHVVASSIYIEDDSDSVTVSSALCRMEQLVVEPKEVAFFDFVRLTINRVVVLPLQHQVISVSYRVVRSPVEVFVHLPSRSEPGYHDSCDAEREAGVYPFEDCWVTIIRFHATVCMNVTTVIPVVKSTNKTDGISFTLARYSESAYRRLFVDFKVLRLTKNLVNHFRDVDSPLDFMDLGYHRWFIW